MNRSGSFSPEFADVFVGCEAFERLEMLGEVVGADKVGEMASKLIVSLIVEALAGRRPEVVNAIETEGKRRREQNATMAAG